MSPPARVSVKRRMSASVTSGPGRPNISRRPTMSSRVTMCSPIEEMRTALAREPREVCPPRALEAGEGNVALDGAADRVTPAEEIDWPALPLELIGRTAPAEVTRRLAAPFDDQREVGREGLETRGIGDVDLHTLAEVAPVLVKRG